MTEGQKASDRVPFVDLLAQYRSIEPEVQCAMQEVLVKGDFILGPHLEAFEAEFARFVGSKHCVGVSSGLDALKLAVQALGLGADDEVIVPASTYIATGLGVTGAGAKMVLADCDARTANLDPAAFEAAITPRTRAVMPVHLAGAPAATDEILAIAKKRKLAVIEDAAQAHGATYKGRQCGSMGLMGCFSFYPGKNLGAYGDGGAVVTDDAALAEKLRRLRNYGQRAKYEHVELGWNARLDGLQAAILSVKLKRLAGWNKARGLQAAEYRQRLARVPGLDLQHILPDTTSVYHLFFVESDRRDALQAHLNARGIDSGIHYPKAMHEHECYAGLGYRAGQFPNSERRARRTLSLPMYAELSPAQVGRVVDAVGSFFGAAAKTAR